MMTPGTYLARRRAAAGLSIDALALALAASPLAVRRASAVELAQLAQRIGLAEKDVQPYSPDQLGIVAGIVPMAPDIYDQLVVLHHARRHHWSLAHGDVEPQICRVCACSWHDACLTAAGPCAWAEDDLCTACASAAEAGLAPPHLAAAALAELHGHEIHGRAAA